MIWIYLDWNILSKFNHSEENHIKELKPYFKKLASDQKISSFFTDEHIWEATNIHPNHENFEEIINSSLAIIDEYLPFYFERKKNSDDFNCWKTSAFEVYRQKKDTFKELRNTFKESLNETQYSKLKQIAKIPKKLSPNYLNNYSTENVIKEINTILNSDEIANIFSDTIQRPITFTKVLKNITEQVPFFSGLNYQVIYQAHRLLNSLGFRKDKIGNNEFLGSWMDTHHLGNASTCQLFITDDTKLRLKAEVIYKYLEIETKIVTSRKAKKSIHKCA